MLYFWTKLTIIGNYAFLLWQPSNRMSMIYNTRIYSQSSYSVFLAGHKTILVSGANFFSTHIYTNLVYTVCSRSFFASHMNIHYIAGYLTHTVIFIYTASVSWPVVERRRQKSCPCEISDHTFCSVSMLVDWASGQCLSAVSKAGSMGGNAEVSCVEGPELRLSS